MAEYTLQALHDEIEADPDGIGYKEVGGAWKGDQEVADLLNNVSGLNPYTVNFSRVDVGAMRTSTTYEAFDGLTASERDWFVWLTNGLDIIVESHLLVDLAGIGGASRWAVADRPVMEPAMAALLQFQGSRAEFLWGEGRTVSAGHVGAAANV